MKAVKNPLLAGVRRLLANGAASLRRSLGMEPHDRDFTSQRMCPFCGMITARFESSCLECGKALGRA
jgi:hypothetical protein